MNTLHLLLAIPVFLLAAAALGYAVSGLTGGRDYTRRMWDLAAWFTASLYVQIVTGFFVIFSTTNRSFDRTLGLHMILSVVAAVLAQASDSVNRRRPREERTYSTHIWGIGAAVVLVLTGILILRLAS